MLALGLAGWIYDTGRRLSGFESSEADRELNELRDKFAQREEELARLRAVSTETESQFQIERTTQQRLSEQIKGLEAENARLREDLAVFEHLASNGPAGAGEAVIRRLQVAPDALPGAYHYRMLLSVNGEKEFHGRLQISVAMSQGGKAAMLSLPASGAADAQKYLLGFKNFHRVEGSFNVPADAVVSLIEVRLLQGEKVVATQRARL